MRYTDPSVREGEPDPFDEQALRARVRELVAEGRTADALDAVLDRVAFLGRRGDASSDGATRDDAWLGPPEIEPIEGSARRRSALAQLPRVILEGEARCPRCGGEEGTLAARERLELSAGALRVEVRTALACARCGTAPRPGLRPGAGLLAHVVVAAHGDGVPYARQALAFRRGGAAIAGSVLEAWTAAVADALAPLAQEIARRVSSSSVVIAGRSGVASVRVGDGRWCAVSAAPDDGLLARAGGWIVRDDGAIRGPARSHPSSSVREAASWEPLRRALVASAREGSAHAGSVLALMQRLHQIERAATDEGVSVEERRRRRAERSAPVLDHLRRACVELRTGLDAGSPLARTLEGALARWDALARFVQDGRIPLDTAIVDRVVRSVASLRSPSDAGSVDARTCAIATVLGTYELASVAPVPALAGVLRALETGVRVAHVAELLPVPP